MWVEIFCSLRPYILNSSSSSWGCELKYRLVMQDFTELRHPLREDVSWNVNATTVFPFASSHPLREDVSWNVYGLMPYYPVVVILFVRMWVEISNLCHSIANRFGHPLREDVSWNNYIGPSDKWDEVILFVRMWVEILRSQQERHEDVSSSSWGCELKYTLSLRFFMTSLVILFVRMWVEIPCLWMELQPVLVILFVRMWVEMPFAFSSFSKAMSSSSSWGCELKYARKPRDPKLIARHPLREDVSWNI